VIDAAALSTALWWAMAAVAIGAMLWLFSGLVRGWQTPPDGEGERAAPPRAS